MNVRASRRRAFHSNWVHPSRYPVRDIFIISIRLARSLKRSLGVFFVVAMFEQEIKCEAHPILAQDLSEKSRSVG